MNKIQYEKISVKSKEESSSHLYEEMRKSQHGHEAAKNGVKKREKYFLMIFLLFFLVLIAYHIKNCQMLN